MPPKLRKLIAPLKNSTKGFDSQQSGITTVMDKNIESSKRGRKHDQSKRPYAGDKEEAALPTIRKDVALSAQATGSPLAMDSRTQNTSLDPAHTEHSSEALLHNLQDVTLGIVQLEQERRNLEDQVKQLQRMAFKNFDTPGWEPSTFEHIARKLKSLEYQIKKWSKSYVSGTLPSPNAEYSQPLISMVAKVSGFDITIICQHLQKDRLWILLQSIITCAMYEMIIEDPFFGVTQEVAGVSIHSNSMEEEYLLQRTLAGLYQNFRQSSLPDAVSWRVQTLRQLNPRGRRNFSGEQIQMQNIARERSKEGRLRQVEQVCNWVLTHFAPVIRSFSDMTEKHKSNDELVAILDDAADIALNIWVQKQDLKTEYCENLKFQSRNDLMEAHQVHNAALSLNETALDNRRIELITHPAVLLKVQKDDEGSTGDYTLRRAVCLVRENPKPGDA